MNIAYTVCNRNNLPNALVLAESYLSHHPDRTFYIGWVDRPMLISLPANVQIIQITDTAIPDLKKMSGWYYDFEMVPACRPWFALYLLKQFPQIKRLSFFSPACFIHSKADEIERKCKSMLLTPNILKPLPENSILKDRNILNIGMVHAGSWIVRPNPQTIRFIEWWASRTYDRARFDLCNGMCMDQLWLNYALSWIEDAAYIQHSGWHTGLHSLPQHKITFIGKKPLVSEQELITTDFTGLADYHPVWSDHKKLLNTSKAFRKLLKGYHLEVSKQSGLVSNAVPGYGIPTRISAFREARKGFARQLRSVTGFIDRIPL